MSNATKPGFKNKLTECLQLRHQGGASAYRRAKLLCDVFEDREFRESLANADDLRMAAELDAYVEDLCLDFLDLRAILAFAPEQSQWADGRLKRLYAEMLEARTTKRGETPKPPRRMATVKQLDAAEKRAEELHHRVETFKSEADELREKLAEANKEIARLRHENARLEGRLAELERIANVAAA